MPAPKSIALRRSARRRSTGSCSLTCNFPCERWFPRQRNRSARSCTMPRLPDSAKRLPACPQFCCSSSGAGRWFCCGWRSCLFRRDWSGSVCSRLRFRRAHRRRGIKEWRRVRLRLLEFGVFGFGFLEDGNVRIGVFPKGEEVLVSGACFSRIVLQGVGARKLNLRHGNEIVDRSAESRVQNFLKLHRRQIPVLFFQVRQAAKIRDGKTERSRANTHFGAMGWLQHVDRFVELSLLEAEDGQEYRLILQSKQRIVRVLLLERFESLFCLRSVSTQCQRNQCDLTVE